MSLIDIRRREPRAAPRFARPLHPVLARVYAARGVAGDEDLNLELDQLLPVSSLPGVQDAAQLLLTHRGRRVLIVGDFDADGATSSALMVRGLRALGFEHVDYMVPDRFRFGYGLTPGIVEAAAEREPSLIVTVDNGVASLAGVALARERHIEVLVTDHHLPGRELPEAQVIVNPNLAGSSFASRNLAGVGVAFYVIAAVCKASGARFSPAALLDLVALGTVADLVPLDRNNRILVQQGLARIRAGRCVPGIRALLEAAGRRIEAAGTGDLGFAVAPRLNAAGRLTDMSLGIACLLADDAAAAASAARQLSELNSQRRDIEARMQEEAIGIATRLLQAAQADAASGAARGPAGATGLCLFDEGWHPGVVGLVAGRLKDRLHRPVIAFAPGEGGTLRGSARSVEGVHIRDVLDAVATQNPGLIEKFGGHAMAAGLTLDAARYAQFTQAFDAAINAHCAGREWSAHRYSDGELGAAEFDLDTARALRGGGPWGQGFPEPAFDGEFTLLETRLVGERHLKMRLRAATGAAPIDGIQFGYLGGEFDVPAVRSGARVRLLYKLEVNEYNGSERLQLNCAGLMPL